MTSLLSDTTEVSLSTRFTSSDVRNLNCRMSLIVSLMVRRTRVMYRSCSTTSRPANQACSSSQMTSMRSFCHSSRSWGSPGADLEADPDAEDASHFSVESWFDLRAALKSLWNVPLSVPCNDERFLGVTNPLDAVVLGALSSSLFGPAPPEGPAPVDPTEEDAATGFEAKLVKRLVVST